MLLFATKTSNLITHLECIVDDRSRLAIFIEDWAIQFNCIVDLDGEPASKVCIAFNQTASIGCARCCIPDASVALSFLQALGEGVVQVHLDETSLIFLSGMSRYKQDLALHSERICELSEYSPVPFPESFAVWDRVQASVFVNQLRVLKSISQHCVFSDGGMSDFPNDVMKFQFFYEDTEPVTFDIDRLLFYFESNTTNEMHIAINGLFFSRSGDVNFYLAPVV